MWRLRPLFMMRKMFFSKGRAASNSSTKDFPEEQHSHRCPISNSPWRSVSFSGLVRKTTTPLHSAVHIEWESKDR
jgi:hypothetical protein